MNDIMKHLDNTFLWLSKIPVSGESVDYMAMARQELRAAFSKLSDDKPSSEVKNDG